MHKMAPVKDSKYSRDNSPQLSVTCALWQWGPQGESVLFVGNDSEIKTD